VYRPVVIRSVSTICADQPKEVAVMKRGLFSFALILRTAVSARARENVGAHQATINAGSQMCISCHETCTPGGVRG